MQGWWKPSALRYYGTKPTNSSPSLRRRTARRAARAHQIPRSHNDPMIRYLTAGESHGEALVGIDEGMPAGVPLAAADLDAHLARRWLGVGRGGRAKIESDRVRILSGVRFGRTMGSPIALWLENASHHRDRAGWPET